MHKADEGARVQEECAPRNDEAVPTHRFNATVQFKTTVMDWPEVTAPRVDQEAGTVTVGDEWVRKLSTPAWTSV